MRKPTKITRVAKEEKIVIPLISEDLQDMYDKLKDKHDDSNRAYEAVCEDKNNLALLKDYSIKEYEGNRLNFDFWYEIRNRYNLWENNIGIRDGYCIVTFKNQELLSNPFSIKDIIVKMKRDLGVE